MKGESKMTNQHSFETYESKCSKIIHSAAAACGTIGASPIPGIGIDKSFATAMVKE